MCVCPLGGGFWASGIRSTSTTVQDMFPGREGGRERKGGGLDHQLMTLTSLSLPFLPVIISFIILSLSHFLLFLL